MLLFIGLDVKLKTDRLRLKLQAIKKQAPKKLEEGAGRTVLRLLDDALNEPPKPPVDTGFLRRSWAAFVGNRKIAGGGEERGGTPDDNRTTGTVAFDSVYAAYQHELAEPINHAKPDANMDSGPKFLEAKLARNQNEYVRELVKDILGTGGAR